MTRLLQEDWLDLVAREGTAQAVRAQPMAPDADAEPPCPACGTAAPLLEGECSECGLYLGG